MKVNMENIEFAFNKFYFDFLKDLKNVSGKNGSVKKSIRRNYLDKDSRSSQYIDKVISFITDEMIAEIVSGSDITKVCANVELIQDYKLDNLLTELKSFEMESYLYIFMLFIFMKKEKLDGKDLFEIVMNIIRDIQKGNDVETQIATVKPINATIATLLEYIKKFLLVQPNPTSGIENTKIGEIAKEIAEDLDLEGLNLKNPEDILKGNGDVLGKIVSNVSQKLQKKFEDGSINHDELLKEAMSVIGGMGKSNGGGMNDIFMNLMKSFGSGAGGAGSGVNSKTANRLRSKLKLKDQSKK